MKMTLADTPGGKEFIARCVAAVEEMALSFVGEPDDRVAASLEVCRQNLTQQLAAEIGAENAAAVADAMVKAVMGQKAYLESLQAGQA